MGGWGEQSLQLGDSLGKLGPSLGIFVIFLGLEFPLLLLETRLLFKSLLKIKESSSSSDGLGRG